MKCEGGQTDVTSNYAFTICTWCKEHIKMFRSLMVPL